MADPTERRVVLLGKTGDGKSSTGNTILGYTKFLAKTSPNSVTKRCEAETSYRADTGTTLKIVDTPGFFDTRLPEQELIPEIFRCITITSPGPHAFVIVLKLGRYTEQEAETVSKITGLIGDDAFKYTVILFTCGNELKDNKTIEQFVEESEDLKKLVLKCGGRCHVIDNKYWNQEHEYRSNRVQVEKLLNTIEEMVAQHGGQCYTNEMLQQVERRIQDEQHRQK